MDSSNTQLENYLDAYNVQTRDSSDKDYFSAIVKIALSEYGTPIMDIADECRVSEGTVQRWSEGRSLPPRLTRQNVLDRILDKI